MKTLHVYIFLAPHLHYYKSDSFVCFLVLFGFKQWWTRRFAGGSDRYCKPIRLCVVVYVFLHYLWYLIVLSFTVESIDQDPTPDGLCLWLVMPFLFVSNSNL